jgi:hypothetical protein
MNSKNKNEVLVSRRVTARKQTGINERDKMDVL